MVVRMGETVGVAEFVQHDAEGEAALAGGCPGREDSSRRVSTLNAPMPCWVP